MAACSPSSHCISLKPRSSSFKRITVALSIVVLGVHRGGRVATSAFGCTFAALAIVSLFTPALSTTDPYEYAAASLLGFAAYTAPPHAFATTTSRSDAGLTILE